MLKKNQCLYPEIILNNIKKYEFLKEYDNYEKQAK